MHNSPYRVKSGACETGPAGGAIQVTIRGRRRVFRFTKLPGGTAGECDDPAAPGKQIWISKGLGEACTLEAIVHEALHAADREKREEWDEQVARDIARLPWRLGHRRKTGVDDPPA